MGRLFVILAMMAVASLVDAASPASWWPEAVEKALERAEGNREELTRALERVPAEQRSGLAFLLEHMPPRDLRTLKADFLLENVALAYQTRKETKWARTIPEDIFLDNVLPYANLDEARDPWRKQLRELCLPLIKDAKTPAEAAQKINATLFQKLNVRFSTKRKKPNQSPKETIEQGMASCTGLSVLLADACRSVGVPARVVGTPLWANKRGNHTWVEVWDGGWHFTGAAEQDPAGLDRGWFVHDASQAQKDSREHSIYAASFRRTGTAFPMVWARDRTDVPAMNVTERYTVRVVANPRVRVLIRVVREGTKERLVLPVAIEERPGNCLTCQGKSRGGTADPNDILVFELQPGRDHVVRVGSPVRIEKPFRTTTAKDQLIDVEVPADRPGLSAEQAKQLASAVRAYFEAPAAKQADWRFDEKLEALLRGNEDAVRRAVWAAYREAPIHAAAKKDFQANEVRSKEHLSPYTVKKVGTRPANGWPLFIAMHGGGGAPKRVNDSQWQIMQRYYRDHPDASGYLYVALRAPNDTWNGFYADYVLPLVVNLVRQFLLLGDVDPDKVYLMGYSHGGYGAFFLGPKLADRFAAVHVSAAAPTDGTISAKTLRNLRFTFMIGEKDTAYGRVDRCKKFDALVDQLRKDNPGDYPVKMEYMEGFGHGGLPDRDKVKDMVPYRRNAVPRRVSWDLTDGEIDRFYWLGVKKAAPKGSIEATLRDNTVTLTTKEVGEVELSLDRRLVRFDRPLVVVRDGKKWEVAIRPSLATLCRSLAERGDPELACTCRVQVEKR